MNWLLDHLADFIGVSALVGILMFAGLYQTEANWRLTRQGRAIMYLARGISSTIILLVFFSFLPELIRSVGIDPEYRTWRWIAEVIIYSPMAWACWNLYFSLREALGLPMLFLVSGRKCSSGKMRVTKENTRMATFGETPEVKVGDEVIVEHDTTVELVQPTQVANPGKTSVRSFVQSLIAGLLLVNPVFLAIQSVMAETTAFEFPAWAWTAVNGVVVGSALVTTLFARIMAVPGVNTWIESHVPALAPTKASK